MRLSTRTLTAAGSAFVLLALAFLFFMPGGLGKTNGNGTSSSGTAAWNGNGKSEPRENTKRSRRTRGLGMDDPEVQRKAEEWYQDLLARHPEFQIEFRDIPDGENGFLRYLDLLEDLKPGDHHNASLPMEADMRGMLDGTKPFNAAQLDAWIAENPELFQSILRIAEATGQSVKGVPMDRYRFIGARVAHEMGLLLQGSARAAMDRGDSEQALRFHRATLNLASHFDGIEIPSLLSKTVSVLLRLTAAKSFHENILPGLVADPAALATWRETMPLPESINDTAQTLFNGEWHLATRVLILPGLISGDAGLVGEASRSIAPTEQRAVLDSYTSQMDAFIRQSATTPFANLIDGSQQVIRSDPSLSPAGNELLDFLNHGAPGWFKGLGRYVSYAAQQDALLAIALGENPAPEPITGEPFLWDPATMTLSPPAGLAPFEFDIKPLKLPAAR